MSWTIKKGEHWRIGAFELRCWRWLLRDDSWVLDCKIKPVNPKGNQFWIFIGRTEAEVPILWPPDVKNWPTGKDPDNGKHWRQEEKGTTEDEMVGWHHQYDTHEFEQAPGVGDRERSLTCCSRWGHKDGQTRLSDWTEVNENENTTHLNLWNATKAVLRRKFTVLVRTLKKKLEKEQVKPKVNRKK